MDRFAHSWHHMDHKDFQGWNTESTNTCPNSMLDLTYMHTFERTGSLVVRMKRRWLCRGIQKPFPPTPTQPWWGGSEISWHHFLFLPCVRVWKMLLGLGFSFLVPRLWQYLMTGWRTEHRTCCCHWCFFSHTVSIKMCGWTYIPHTFNFRNQIKLYCTLCDPHLEFPLRGTTLGSHKNKHQKHYE